jgi:hypothetical protein
MEQHYAFIKDNRVINVAVFASQDETLADAIAKEQGYDDAVWVGANAPSKYSFYNGKTFIDADLDYLYEIGISNENEAMAEARRLEEAEKIDNPNSVI